MSCLISARPPRFFIPACLPVTLSNAALRHACRRLSSADLDDCRIEFAETMLLHHNKELAWRQSGPDFNAWLNRCARNHVEDFCRRRNRRMRHEVAWPEYEDESVARTPQTPASLEAPCDTLTLRRECRRRVMQAVQRLAPTPRDLFLRHCLHGGTLTELADATGKTPDAVGKIIKRACTTLRATLERQGMTEADACEYLAAMQWGGN